MFGIKIPGTLNSRLFGRKQELLAESYLKQRGLRCVARNFTWPGGELDLVMLDPPFTLVFIEVRYRSNPDYGSALASISPAKQRRVRNTAARFLQEYSSFRGHACRFDVVGITPGAGGERSSIRWIKNAFH